MTQGKGKQGQQAKDLFIRAYNRTDLLDHVFREQEATARELNEDIVKWVPQNLFNSYVYSLYGTPMRQGDFIVHFPGVRPRSLTLKLMYLISRENGIHLFYYRVYLYRYLLGGIEALLYLFRPNVASKPFYDLYAATLAGITFILVLSFLLPHFLMLI